MTGVSHIRLACELLPSVFSSRLRSISVSSILQTLLAIQAPTRPRLSMNGYAHMNGASTSAQPQMQAQDQSGIVVPAGVTNQPRVLVRNLSQQEAVFNLSGVELAYANSLRRVVMADVPTVCEWRSHIKWIRDGTV